MKYSNILLIIIIVGATCCGCRGALGSVYINEDIRSDPEWKEHPAVVTNQESTSQKVSRTPISWTKKKAHDPIIIAVFDIHDFTDSFDDKMLLQLTNYLATALTSLGNFQVIPREQLRARLLDQKKGSHRQCIEQSCQIELGKALSAQKSLATQLIRIGNKCALTANMFDLKKEASELGATVETKCVPEDLMTAVIQIAEQLVNKL